MRKKLNYTGIISKQRQGRREGEEVLFIFFALLETSLSGSVYRALNGRMISKWYIGKDVKWSGRGPFQSTVARRKYRCQTAIRLGHLLSTSWKHCALNHLAQNIIFSSAFVIIFKIHFIYYIITHISFFFFKGRECMLICLCHALSNRYKQHNKY